MNIQKIKITELKPAEYNPRKDLKPEDIEYQKIKRSITCRIKRNKYRYGYNWIQF